MKFIEAEQVPELEAVVHLVVASSDTRHSVATAADLELKSKQRYRSGYLEKMMLVFLMMLSTANVEQCSLVSQLGKSVGSGAEAVTAVILGTTFAPFSYSLVSTLSHVDYC